MLKNYLPYTNRGRAGRFKRRVPTFRLSLWTVYLVLPWLVSCAGVSPPENNRISHVIPNVPFHPQEVFQCGPASLAGVLNYWRVDVIPEEIASEVYSKSAKGTLTLDMVSYAEQKGLRARQYRGSLEDLKNRIDSGYPLIVLVDQGFLIYQKNHFMVIIGYEEEGIVANSGREQQKLVPLKEFLRSWEKAKFWTLLITPK